MQSCSTLCNSMNYSPPPPLSVEFSRQEHWSRLQLPSPGERPDPGIETGLLYCRQIPYYLSHQDREHHWGSGRAVVGDVWVQRTEGVEHGVGRLQDPDSFLCFGRWVSFRYTWAWRPGPGRTSSWRNWGEKSSPCRHHLFIYFNDFFLRQPFKTQTERRTSLGCCLNNFLWLFQVKKTPCPQVSDAHWLSLDCMYYQFLLCVSGVFQSLYNKQILFWI